jgi:hypothetical protein
MAFEAFLTHGKQRAKASKWRRLTLALSLGLHGALLVGAVVYSFWHVDELKPPVLTVTFLNGVRAAPPPPPPSPAKQEAAKPKPKVAKPTPPKFEGVIQPPEKRPEPPPPREEPVESDEKGGLEGADNGVPGSTGTPETAAVAAPPPAPEPPPPPPKVQRELPPVMLPPNVGTGQRISDVTDPRFRPSLPGTLSRSGMMLWGLFRICVGADGHVTDVKVLKSADPMVDGEWINVIRRWEYRPFSIEGRAVPFCHASRIEVRGSS